MNRIFRIVWSKTRNCYVVASELAKRHTKNNGARAARSLTARMTCGMILGVLLAGGFYIPVADAATMSEATTTQVADSIAWYDGKIQADGSGSIAMGSAVRPGSSIYAGGSGSIAMGSVWVGGSITALGNGSIAMGDIWNGGSITALGDGSVAIGRNVNVIADYSIAVGSNNRVGTFMYYNGEADIEAKIVEYTNDEGETRYKIVKVSDGSVLDDRHGYGYENLQMIENFSDLRRTGNASTAFGKNSTAYADNSLAALGGYTEIEAKNSAAIGNEAKAELANTVALGSKSVANRAAGAEGYGNPDGATGAAWVSTHNAIAVGASANDSDTATVTRQITGVAAGTYDTDAVNVAQLKAATAITDAHNYYDGSTDAVAVTDAVNAVDKALGKVEAGNYITAYDATAGTGTFADNLKALDDAIGTKIEKDGNFIKKSDTNSVNANIMALDEALGQNAKAIGQNAEAIGQNTDAIKQNAEAIKQNADAIGQNVEAIKDNKKAIDKNTGDISALKAQDGQVVPEGKTKADEFVKGETVYDYLNKDDLSFGDNSTKIAIGKGSKVQSGTQSLAIGFGNTVDGDQNVAIGTGHTVKGSHNIAIGDPIELVGDNNGVIGNNSTITGNDNFVIGNGSTVKGNNTFVLGNNVTANANNAVVLGNNSTAEENAVSVGSAGGERQIKHVKAGTDDTDAVNVSQLKALEQQATDNDVMLNNRINNVDNKINKVGAGAAALAALHPLDTDDKFSMGLGYGNYRDAHAGAIGLFYRPTDKVMLSVAGSMGNGENMINAGITFALDKGKGFGTSKAAMARKINQQENQIQALQIENAKLAERLAAIEAKLEK